jgi:hypothetical protein
VLPKAAILVETCHNRYFLESVTQDLILTDRMELVLAPSGEAWLPDETNSNSEDSLEAVVCIAAANWYWTVTAKKYFDFLWKSDL